MNKLSNAGPRWCRVEQALFDPIMAHAVHLFSKKLFHKACLVVCQVLFVHDVTLDATMFAFVGEKENEGPMPLQHVCQMQSAMVLGYP